MDQRAYNLAIETSGKVGSISLGRGDELIETRVLEQKRRHNIELLPAVAGLCEAHGVGPGRIGELYVALGPGSFTGLRVALAAVKMVALCQQVAVVGVPSLEIVAQNTPEAFEYAAVCLNLKRQTVHSAVFHREGARMHQADDAGLRTLDELLATAPRPVALIGDPLPTEAADLDDPQVTVCGGETAHGRSEVVWQLGRERATQGEYDDPATLSPLYIREPEAVTLWDQRHGAG